MSLYQEITDQIIEQIESGTPPWRQPWTGSATPSIPLRSTGEAYKGINVLLLWATAMKNGFKSQHWMTYKQAKTLGGQVRKGEKSTTVIYYNVVEKNEDGKEVRIPFAKGYRVFNADQIDGLGEAFYIQPDPPRDLGTEPDAELDAFFESTGAEIRVDDVPRAYYRPSEDYIHMPPISTFESAPAYYGVLAHELIHWTGAEKRLDRLKKFSSKNEYAFEELIAEIGNCMLCAEIGIPLHIDQSAAYVESWLKVLKEDNRAIFKAASASQKACEFLTDAQSSHQIAAE